MKNIAVIFFSFLFISMTAFGQTQKTLDVVTECKLQLDVLKIIADEQCRMIPDYISDGYGYALGYLHPGMCRNASDDVLRKAEECKTALR